MLIRYRIGIFKSSLTQQCLSFKLITVTPSLQINFSRNALIDCLETKLCDKIYFMLIWRLIAFLMTCFTHKKISFMSDPLCFEASTEARRIQNTNGPLNWPSNWALWKWNGCHHTDAEKYTTTACFPPVRNMKNTHQMLVFMILLSEVTTTLIAQVNKLMKVSIIEHERRVCMDENRGLSPADLLCWPVDAIAAFVQYNSRSILLSKLVLGLTNTWICHEEMEILPSIPQTLTEKCNFSSSITWPRLSQNTIL